MRDLVEPPLDLELSRFPARFRRRFSHASAARTEAENVICAARGGGLVGYGEGCPRAYVTCESVETSERFFRAFQPSLAAEARDLDGLRAWIAARRADIDANPAAFAAIEIALLDLFARRSGLTVEALLGLPPPPPVRASAVFGLSGPIAAVAIGALFRLRGMMDAKVKISGDLASDARRIAAIRRALGRRARLRLDANNAFPSPDACVAHLKGLDAPIWAIEEPLAARDYDGLRAVAAATGARIILDESAARPADLDALAGGGWIVNLRVSKMGGVLRSLEMVEAARIRGVDVILGAHVGETSLLARAALTIAAAAAPIAAEIGYGPVLLRRDLARPAIGFGRGGRIAWRGRGSGFGLAVDAAALAPLARGR